MNGSLFKVAADNTHHLDENGLPAYAERFDEVLKFHPPGLAPVVYRGKAWHIRPDGSPAYTHRFQRTFGFYEGFASVVSRDGWHHITPDGHDAYRERYAWCGNFQGGRCTVRQTDGSYFHIGTEGRPAYAQRWAYAGDYRDGTAVVQARNGRSTHIDLHGCLIHGKWFLGLDVFHKGFARARDEDGWMHVNAQGKPTYTRRFAAVEPFYNGQAHAERFDGALEVIDELGRTVVELRPPLRSEFAALSGDMVGYWRTQTIATAVRLGVIEALPNTEGQVAERCGLRPDGARRLLRALGELNLVRNENGCWHDTPRGAYLRRSHPWTLADAALEYGGPLSSMWKSLSDALCIGSDWTAPDVFGEVAQDERRREGHHRMLRSYARHDYPEVERALELRGNERIIDAGGGLGTLAGMLVDAFPSIHVTVVDRPEVVEQGQREFAGVNRVHWLAANLFEPWGIQGDAVILSRVLHDWDDTAALRILANARGALPVGGKVFIVEMLIPDGSVAGALCDLHLLVATGGRERSAAEFERLLRTSGFKLAEVRPVAALPTIVVGVAV